VEITVSLYCRHQSSTQVFVAAADPSRELTTSPFAAMANNPGQPQDYNKLFKAELDNLQFAEGLYSWIGNDVEHRVLRRYGKL
jgi:ER membrane protein complex subunit 3